MSRASRRQVWRLLLSALLALGCTLALPALSTPDAAQQALELSRSAQQSYSAGKFDEAARFWQQAAAVYEQAGDQEGTTKSLIDRSQALQNLGLYAKACDTLLQAFGVNTLECKQAQLEILAQQLSTQTLSLPEAVGLRSLGQVLRRQGFLERSQEFLQLSLAVTQGTPQESATLLSLGNTERAIANRVRDRLDYEQIAEIIARQSPSAALEPYQEAFRLYRAAVSASTDGEELTSLQAQLNHLSLLLTIQQWWEQTSRRINSSQLGQTKRNEEAEKFLAQLQQQLDSSSRRLQQQIRSSIDLPISPAAIDARINYANALIRLEQLDEAETMLATAQTQARAIADWSAESYALGYLGRVSSLRGQSEPAIELTRQALAIAQEQQLVGDAREIAYLWQFQLGRLLKEQETPEAIVAYGAAYNTLQSLRSDLNANNQDVQFNFREEVRPVYLGLVDLLLQSELTEAELELVLLNGPQAETNGYAEPLATASASRLRLARNIIESLQLAELDNFFQDPCVEESDVAVQLDELDPQAAVLYPIVLSDRLAVILSLPDGSLYEASTPVSEVDVNATLDTLYDSLDNPTVDNSARNILSTSNPALGELAENLQTLLPALTQVYDWLIRPFEGELVTNNIETLVFVLNGQLQKVPMAALYDGRQYLLENYRVALAPSLQLLNPNPSEDGQLKVLAAGVSQPAQVRGESFPALDNVPEELNQIQAVFPRSQQLLNEEFTALTLQAQLQEEFPVVHLATHAQFSSNPEQNFIVTGQDSSISIEQLSELFQGDAPDLLVLSACQTATGDEQAILGLAGVAVRSGVRSTLATLWSVEDVSTAQLMGQFYQELAQPETKLEALRSAQLSLIDTLKVNPPLPELQGLPPHPYYWAPYVLVGNWK